MAPPQRRRWDDNVLRSTWSTRMALAQRDPSMWPRRLHGPSGKATPKTLGSPLRVICNPGAWTAPRVPPAGLALRSAKSAQARLHCRTGGAKVADWRHYAASTNLSPFLDQPLAKLNIHVASLQLPFLHGRRDAARTSGADAPKQAPKRWSCRALWVRASVTRLPTHPHNVTTILPVSRNHVVHEICDSGGGRRNRDGITLFDRNLKPLTFDTLLALALFHWFSLPRRTWCSSGGRLVQLRDWHRRCVFKTKIFLENEEHCVVAPVIVHHHRDTQTSLNAVQPCNM